MFIFFFQQDLIKTSALGYWSQVSVTANICLNSIQPPEAVRRVSDSVFTLLVQGNDYCCQFSHVCFRISEVLLPNQSGKLYNGTIVLKY